MTKFMNIQQFSERTGISKSALRFYEEKQLLFPQERSANGYRVYAEHQIATVKLISSLRLADLSIKEIKAYLAESDEATRLNMLDAWIHNIKKKRDLLNVSLRYLESESFTKELYLIEKSAEQIIWFHAESKVGEFRQHFLNRASELEKQKIPFKNFYLKYLSGDHDIKVQIGFGIPYDYDVSDLLKQSIIEQVPPCICIAMPFKDAITTIQKGHQKLLRYAIEHNWTPLSSILEWYHGENFSQLDLLLPVTQIEKRGEY